MQFLGILILIVLFIALFWPRISAWLKRKAMERAENYLRSAMGMPPREKERKRQAAGSASYGNRSRYSGGNERNGHAGYYGSDTDSIIPKEYAEDVEFTETIDYSSESREKTETSSESYHESQISDVEWTEIKR